MPVPTMLSRRRIAADTAGERRDLRARAVAMLSALLLATLAMLPRPGRAGVFDDDEARKAILDLRTKVAQNDEAGRKRDADLGASLQQLSEQLQKSLLDLANQNEQLRAELAKLRGANEQLARDVSELQRRQKDVIQGVDERLRKVEPQKVALDGQEFLADPEEFKAYDDAIAALRGGDFEKSGAALSAFARRYPGSGYIDAARYWLGNAQYGKRDYKEAIATFRAFVAGAPAHPRAPEALLAVANCQIEMKDTKLARKTLDEVIKTYPKAEAAVAAKERLAALK